MDKHNAVGVALLKIGRRDKATDIQTDGKQNGGGARKPGNHLSRQRIKSRGRRVFVPVHCFQLKAFGFDRLGAELSTLHSGFSLSFVAGALKAARIFPVPNTSYSSDIFNAADAAQGANTNDTTRNAPSNERFACGLMPVILASTAPAPKIKTGI